MELKTLCAKYVAFLRALYLLHQNHHWVSQGQNFYGNHLLFQRIYESTQTNVDSAAEKIIGVFGADNLGLQEQNNLIKEFLDTYQTSDSIIENSLKAEKDFLQFGEKFYTALKENDKMTLGLDDMIMSIANDRETSVYLLKQAMGKDMNKLSNLAKKFQIKLAQTANQAVPAKPNPNAGPQNGAEAQQMLDNMKLQEVGEAVKSEVAQALGLRDLQSNDLQFTTLRFVNSNGKKSIEWAMKVSPRIVKQFQAGVTNQQKGNASFAVGRYVGQLFNQKMPGIPVLSAQPIALG